MSEITDKIRSRGHWEIVVRPAEFVADRVPYSALLTTIENAAVRFRGWPVPFVDLREPVIRGSDWIGGDVDARVVDHYEAWRFWMSGQFSQLRSVSADWREGTEATQTPPGFAGVIEVWEILFYLTEVFELAARLALNSAGDESMIVDVTLRGLSDRGLVVGQRNRAEFVQPYRSGEPKLALGVTLHRDVLVAEAREQAVTMAREFFLRFGWEPAVEQLRSHQNELTHDS